MRKIIIAGNWKMHKTLTEAIELTTSLKRELCDVNEIEIAICPPFTCLDQIADLLQDSNIKFGGQNMHYKNEGAFTGEISPVMLKNLRCDYVILGHSERRQYFFESNELVNLKVKAALEYGLVPIVCVGEKIEERKAQKTFDVVRDQIRNSLNGLTKDQLKKCVIAYEPVWAIGTGLTATPQQAQEVHAFIRTLLKEMSDAESAQEITIQYGGSVKPENAKDLIKENDIDGALVGGASLKADSFVALIRNSLEYLKVGKGKK